MTEVPGEANTESVGRRFLVDRSFAVNARFLLAGRPEGPKVDRPAPEGESMDPWM
jgi:hypothetical protein